MIILSLILPRSVINYDCLCSIRAIGQDDRLGDDFWLLLVLKLQLFWFLRVLLVKRQCSNILLDGFEGLIYLRLSR